MTQETARAAKARELAAWLREIAGDETGGLMARAASALEREAGSETRSRPRVATRPVKRAANDNLRPRVRRRKS